MEQNQKFSTIQNTFSTLFAALFGLGDSDDPDIIKRNLRIADYHNHELTKEHRRQLCDSAHLPYEEFKDLVHNVRLRGRTLEGRLTCAYWLLLGQVRQADNDASKSNRRQMILRQIVTIGKQSIDEEFFHALEPIP